MALSNKDRQAAIRSRRLKLGLKRRDYFLSNDEKIKVDAYVDRLISKREKTDKGSQNGK